MCRCQGFFWSKIVLCAFILCAFICFLWWARQKYIITISAGSGLSSGLSPSDSKPSTFLKSSMLIRLENQPHPNIQLKLELLMLLGHEISEMIEKNGREGIEQAFISLSKSTHVTPTTTNTTIGSMMTWCPCKVYIILNRSFRWICVEIGVDWSLCTRMTSRLFMRQLICIITPAELIARQLYVTTQWRHTKCGRSLFFVHVVPIESLQTLFLLLIATARHNWFGLPWAASCVDFFTIVYIFLTNCKACASEG